jgi:metal-responsive CopG/Arc/MetJ family transcriptional regulator
MRTSRARAHIAIPESLLEEVDALVGPRRRSEFFEEAAREKVRQEKLRRAAHRLVGSLADTSITGWDSSEEARSWVRSLRQENDQRSAGTEKR